MAADIYGYSTSAVTQTGSNTWTAVEHEIPQGQTRTYQVLLIGKTPGFLYARKFSGFSVFNNAGTANIVDNAVDDITPEYIDGALTGLNFQVSVTTDTLTVIVGGPTAGTQMQWSATIEWSQF